MRLLTGIGIGAAVGFAVALCIALWPVDKPLKVRHSASVSMVTHEHEREEATPLPASPAVVLTPASVAVTSPAAALPDEPLVMNTLRALGDSEPERSLQLARDAEQRFPDSADAAEQEWYVCKSLVNLERFYDAREEARAMVAKYPGTPWATDVERHLLVNPLDLPGDPAP